MNLLYIDRPLVINPALAEKIGLNEAIILQQLNYWLTRTGSGVSYDGVLWVYNTYSEWREQAPFFSERTIQRAILKLEKIGIVRSEMLRKSKGDRTKFYTINQSHELLAPSSRQDDTTITTDCLDHRDKMAPPSCQNGTLSTETTTETTHTLKTLSSKPDRVDEIIDYLNQQAGTGFKHAKSHQRLINARLKEGHTAEDIKTVVDRKVTEWANTRMAKYLRPSTLFSDTNFNNYIGQITVGSEHEGNQQYNNQLTAEQERRARLSKYPAGRIQLQIEDRLAAEQRRDSILVVDNEQDIRPSLDFQSGRRD